MKRRIPDHKDWQKLLLYKIYRLINFSFASSAQCMRMRSTENEYAGLR